MATNTNFEDLSKSDINKLLKRIQNLINYLKFKTIGPDSITKNQFDSIVEEGFINPNALDYNSMDTIPGMYIKTIKLLDAEHVPQTVRNQSLKFLKRNTSNYIDSLGKKLKNDVHSIVAGESTFANKTRSILAEGIEAGDSNQEMAQKLANVFGKFNNNWELVVQTELAHAQNLGAADSIITANKDKKIDEIYVYKQGAIDSKLCPVCRKLWHSELNINVPKVYKLSELVASNVGRNQNDAMPSIAATHPRCRHILLQLPNGYGFDDSGNIVFKNAEHLEYNNQK